MAQDDTLTVLLTGRAETNFADLVKRIVTSKNLSFDMVCLKPETGPNNQRFSSTMNFKQAILADLVYTYKDAKELRIYEDRPKQYVSFYFCLIPSLTMLQHYVLPRLFSTIQPRSSIPCKRTSKTDHYNSSSSHRPINDP